MNIKAFFNGSGPTTGDDMAIGTEVASNAEERLRPPAKVTSSSGNVPLAPIFAKPSTVNATSVNKTSVRYMPFKDPTLFLAAMPPAAPLSASHSVKSNIPPSTPAASSSSVLKPSTNAEPKTLALKNINTPAPAVKGKSNTKSASSTKDIGTVKKARSSDVIDLCDSTSKSSAPVFFLSKDDKQAKLERERALRLEAEAQAREARIQDDLQKNKENSKRFKKEGSGVNAFFLASTASKSNSSPRAEGVNMAVGDTVDFGVVQFMGGLSVGMPDLPPSRPTFVKIAKTIPPLEYTHVSLSIQPPPPLALDLSLSMLDQRAMWSKFHHDATTQVSQLSAHNGTPSYNNSSSGVIDLCLSHPDVVDCTEGSAGMPLSSSCSVNVQSAHALSHWLQKWMGKRAKAKPSKNSSRHDRERPISNLAYLYGPCGSGKTSLVYKVARELGFDIIEISASQLRSGAAVKKSVSEASQSHGVAGSSTGIAGSAADLAFDSNVGKKNSVASSSLILFDDVDIVQADDTGFHSYIQSLQRSSLVPIVLTSSISLRVPHKFLHLNSLTVGALPTGKQEDDNDEPETKGAHCASSTLNWLRNIVLSDDGMPPLMLKILRPKINDAAGCISNFPFSGIAAAPAHIGSDSSDQLPSSFESARLMALLFKCDLRAANACLALHGSPMPTGMPTHDSSTQSSAIGTPLFPSWLLASGFPFAMLDSLPMLPYNTSIPIPHTDASPPAGTVNKPDFTPLVIPIVASVFPRECSSLKHASILTITGRHFLQRNFNRLNSASITADITVTLDDVALQHVVLDDTVIVALVPPNVPGGVGVVTVTVARAARANTPHTGTPMETVCSSACGAAGGWVYIHSSQPAPPLVWAPKPKKGSITTFFGKKSAGASTSAAAEGGKRGRLVRKREYIDSSDEDEGIEESVVASCAAGSKRRRVVEDDDDDFVELDESEPEEVQMADANAEAEEGSFVTLVDAVVDCDQDDNLEDENKLPSAPSDDEVSVALQEVEKVRFPALTDQTHTVPIANPYTGFEAASLSYSESNRKITPGMEYMNDDAVVALHPGLLHSYVPSSGLSHASRSPLSDPNLCAMEAMSVLMDGLGDSDLLYACAVHTGTSTGIASEVSGAGVGVYAVEAGSVDNEGYGDTSQSISHSLLGLVRNSWISSVDGSQVLRDAIFMQKELMQRCAVVDVSHISDANSDANLASTPHPARNAVSDIAKTNPIPSTGSDSIEIPIEEVTETPLPVSAPTNSDPYGSEEEWCSDNDDAPRSRSNGRRGSARRGARGQDDSDSIEEFSEDSDDSCCRGRKRGKKGLKWGSVMSRYRSTAEDEPWQDTDAVVPGRSTGLSVEAMWAGIGNAVAIIAAPVSTNQAHLRATGYLRSLYRRQELLSFVLDTLVSGCWGTEGFDETGLVRAGACIPLYTNSLRRNNVCPSITLDYFPMLSSMLSSELLTQADPEDDAWTSRSSKRRGGRVRGKFEYTGARLGLGSCLSESICEAVILFGKIGDAVV